MLERDRILEKDPSLITPDNKFYVVTPTIMKDYLETVRTSVLKHPDMVVLVPSNDLNPEPQKYYGTDEF